MKDRFKEAVTSGLHGSWTHIDPVKTLKGLSPANARKKPGKAPHCVWELLHHADVWQEAILRQIKGETVDWNGIQETNNWPSEETMADDGNFSILVEKFAAGIKEAEKMLKSADFNEEHSLGEGLPPLSTIKLYMVLLQHNSYHAGQIITTRKCIGDWPADK